MVHFITIAKLKELGFIHDNVDTKTLKTCITRAQDIEIQDALGSNLFEAMLARVEANDVTGIYEELMLKKIQPALTCWVDVRASIHLLTKLTNKTVGKASDEYIKHVDDIKSHKAVKQTLESDAEHYTDRLVTFLKKNCNDIPEYKSDSNEDIQAADSGYKKEFY